MINRITNPGQVLITAPVGGLVAGDAYYDGARFGVCPNDIAAGEDGYMVTEGCFELAFAGGTTPAKNARAFWDPTEKKVYGAWSAGRATCGTFYQAAATDDATCQIQINQGLVDNGESSDITGIEPGAGLTGGGVSGSVELSVDFGTGATQVAAGNHTHAAEDSSYTNAALPTVGDSKEALDAIINALRGLTQTTVAVTIANGQAAGSSAANPTLVGGELKSAVGSTGCESGVMTAILNGDGSVTVTLTDAQAVGDGTVNCFVQPVVPA